MKESILLCSFIIITSIIKHRIMRGNECFFDTILFTPILLLLPILYTQFINIQIHRVEEGHFKYSVTRVNYSFLVIIHFFLQIKFIGLMGVFLRSACLWFP